MPEVLLLLTWILSFVIRYGYLPCPLQPTLIGGVVECDEAGSIIPKLKDAYSTEVQFEFDKVVQRQI